MRRWFRARGDHADQAHAQESERALASITGVAAGLHAGTREGSLVVGGDERLMHVGPQVIPPGVTITLGVGAVWKVL